MRPEAWQGREGKGTHLHPRPHLAVEAPEEVGSSLCTTRGSQQGQDAPLPRQVPVQRPGSVCILPEILLRRQLSRRQPGNRVKKSQKTTFAF